MGVNSTSNVRSHTLEKLYSFFLSFVNLPPSRTTEYCGKQLVGYTMEQMFDVVSDVGNYHKFLPWCKQSVILKKTSHSITADLIIYFKPINECYTSDVTLVKPLLVKAESTDGRLFQHLFTLWRFSPSLKEEQQSCIVDFYIAFQFRSVFYSHIMNLFMNHIANQMKKSFIEEVERRHGPAPFEPTDLLVHKQG